MATECTDCLPTAAAASSSQPATSSQTSAPSPSAAAASLLDSSTFSPPDLHGTQELPYVQIEFCDRCRWLHRATWTMTELFLTFPPLSTTSTEGVKTSSGLKAITLLPRSDPETGGRFRVWLYRERSIEEEYEQNCPDSWGSAELMWDRKIEGGFPELKELKQRIRNRIAPKQDLGHSDRNAFGVKPSKDAGEGKSAGSERKEGVKSAEPETQVDDYTPRFRC